MVYSFVLSTTEILFFFVKELLNKGICLRCYIFKPSLLKTCWIPQIASPFYLFTVAQKFCTNIDNPFQGPFYYLYAHQVYMSSATVIRT